MAKCDWLHGAGRNNCTEKGGTKRKLKNLHNEELKKFLIFPCYFYDKEGNNDDMCATCPAHGGGGRQILKNYNIFVENITWNSLDVFDKICWQG
jgi:hypothetical protein